MSISESILQAVDLLIDSKTSKLQYDKTVQATIYRIDNVDEGEYKVRYNGNIFTAYAQDIEKVYKIDDTVYVVIPEGDFSNRKIISGLATKQSLSQNQLTNLQNQFFPVSETLDKLYNDRYAPDAELGVIAGKLVGEEGQYAYLYQGSDIYNPADYHGLFQQYASKYELIRIQAQFLTQFYNYHNKGNYGLEITFYTKDNSSVAYRLDLSAFNGDPYHLSVYSPQEVIIQTQKNYLLGLKSIKLFEEDFEYDEDMHGNIINNTPNIFVRDVFIQFVDKRDLTDVTYYLMISTPRGSVFTDNVTSIDLIGQLIYQGNDLINDQKCTKQWFKRALDVVVGDERYHRTAGPGWEAIDNKTNSMTIDQSEIFHQQSYKLMTIYNDSVVSQAEASVTNSKSGYSFHIEQAVEGDDILLRLSDSSLAAEWYILYPDSTYQPVRKGERLNAISVSPYLRYSTVTFYCQVYSADNQNLGALSYKLSNSEDERDVTITYIGEDAFRYDANGDVTIEDSEKERTLQANIAWKEGIAASYYITWSMRDGDGKEYELPKTKEGAYTFNDSMMQAVWVDTTNILHYNIRQKYKINNNNNNVILKIHTIDERVYEFSKEILFLKDGDQGTNGTTYICAIRPCDNNGVKLSGFQALKYDDDWLTRMNLRCYAYKNGEPIPDNQLSFRWTGINVLIDNEESLQTTNSQVNISGNSNITVNTDSKDMEFYVKAQVNITDNGKTIVVYTSYPIDILIGTAANYYIDISDIPSYIKYTTSGKNPSFYSNNISYRYIDKVYDEGITSLNEDLILVTEDQGKKYLSPVGSFLFDTNYYNPNQSNIGVLNIELPDHAGRIIHPIIMYLDMYGNEAINGWDGTALDTGDGSYVFAPQVGAGIKNSDNTFTGVIMGKDSGQDKVGLYGYKQGLNTFGLMETGEAYFGAKSGGGQIVIDGTSAIIHGGDVTHTNQSIKPAANGLYIRLANRKPSGTTKAIGIGWATHIDENDREVTEENFYVTYDGKVKMTEADVQGKIYAVAGQIGGTGRNGGWTIENGRLYSGSGEYHVELNSVQEEGTEEEKKNHWSIWAGRTSGDSAPFRVRSDGYVYMTNAYVRGTIEAHDGHIGGWTINQNSLTRDDGKVSIGGDNAFWAGNNKTGDTSGGTYFKVTYSGKVYCKNAEVSGSITATTLTCDNGKIGGWSITSSGLYSENGQVWISANNGFRFGNNFQVNNNGVIVKGDITAYDLQCENGKIGGWTITSSGLYNGNNIAITPSGFRFGSFFQVDSNGVKINGQINVTEGGKIGEWKVIENGTLTNNLTLLYGSASGTAGGIRTKAIEIYHDNQNNLLGTLGLVRGVVSGGVTTYNIGIDSDSGSIILKAGNNMRLTAGNVLYLQANSSIAFTSGNDEITIGQIIRNFKSLENRISALEAAS